MKVAIGGMGVVGGFGHGTKALLQALEGLAPVPQTKEVPVNGSTLTVPCLTADVTPLAEFVPTRVMRRMSHYIRLGLLAAFEAMADADVLDAGRRGRMGIIVATGNGATGNNYNFLYPFEDKEEICGSPTQFSNSVHNAAAAYIAIALSEMGPNLSITHDALSFPSAMLTAQTWLQQGRVDSVLVGGMDELNNAHAYAWHHNRSNVPEAPVAGEGACFFVLRPAEPANGPQVIVREAITGRMGPRPVRWPVADWYFTDHPTIRNAGQENTGLLRPDDSFACYAHLYGDLAVGSAFDTAIAALSLSQGCLWSGMHDRPEPRVLKGGASIVCLTQGMDAGYGWIALKQQAQTK